MKTKLATLLALLGAVIGNSVSAQDYTLTLDQTIGSKYIFRGIELGDTTYHPSIEFGKDDFYLGLWAAFPAEDTGAIHNWSDEIDFYGGKSWALNEKTSIDAGGTFYTYPGADDTFEVYVGLSHELEGGFSLNGYVYRDLDLDAWTIETSGGYSLPLTDSATLDLAVYLGAVEADDATDYGYVGADAVVPIQLSENTTITFGVHWADHNLAGEADNHIYGTAGFTLGF